MTASAKVPLQEWLAAVKPFLKTRAPKRGESSEVMITHENDQLTFRYGGVETQAEAEGLWPGAAYVERRYILLTAKIPPLKNTVVVEVNGDRLKIEGSVCPCRWVPTAKGMVPPFVNEPPSPKPGKDTTFVTLVGMGIDYSDERIASLGLTVPVENARTKKNQIVLEAAHILAPLEITAADLEMLIKKTLGYKYPRL